MNQDPVIKQRSLYFLRDSDSEQPPAREAALVLRELEGVYTADAQQDHCVSLSYDLRHICLEIIESVLADLGFCLDNSLMARLQRGLIYYTEDNERASIGASYDLPHSTQEAFVQAYQQRPHGCRDPRPPAWRKYQ